MTLPYAVQPPSVKSLFCLIRFGEANLSTGTGIVVSGPGGDYLVTNRHNVTGRRNDDGSLLSATGGVPDNIVVFHHVAGRLGHWQGRVESLYNLDGSPRWREHSLLGARADIVALPLVDVDGLDLYRYEISEEPRIAFAPGDIVSVVGFPFGMSTGGKLPIWATGFVASEPGAKLNDSDLPVFYIDCRSRPGQSGSAVIAHRSGGMVAMEGGVSTIFEGPVTRLLGIYSGRVNPESDIGIVWPTSALSFLFESLRETNLGAFAYTANSLNW